MGRAWVGCSGWHYRDWRGVVYPADARPNEWFRSYAERFDTVEINATFYRLPAETTVDAWRSQAPPGFTYAVKVGQFGSHRKKLSDPAGWLGRYLDRVERLGSHLGPNLVQLPPGWSRNVERLDLFLSAAPPSMRFAVELRDPSWLHDDVFATLERHGAALCLHDLLPKHPWIRTAPWTYVRFHGPADVEARYVGSYGGRRLWRPAQRLVEWLHTGDAYVYFNNDWGGAAVDDATWMRNRLAAIAAGGGRSALA